MGYSLEAFYSMTWPEFFLCKKAYDLNEWQNDFRFRLNYVQKHNSLVKKKDQIKLKDILPHHLDDKLLGSNVEKDKITLKEALEIAQMDGQHKGRLGT